MISQNSVFDIAVQFDGRGGASPISDAQVLQAADSDAVYWVNCDQNNPQAREWLAGQSGASKSAVDILLAGETRPRALPESDGLAVILRGINMNPGAVPDDMVAIRIWIEKNRVITAQRRKLLSVNDVYDALLDGKGPKTVGEFLVFLTNALAGRIGLSIDNIEQLVEQLESEVASGNIGELRVALGVVRRQAAAIRRYLAPQRDALERLVRTHAGVLTDREVFEMREESDRLTRQLEDLDLAREQALVTQEELMNRLAQEQNSRMYLLSVVAAIFLPLTFVTGMLGMNVAGLPGLDNPNGFIYSSIIMVGLSIGLVVLFKLKKWI